MLVIKLLNASSPHSKIWDWHAFVPGQEEKRKKGIKCLQFATRQNSAFDTRHDKGACRQDPGSCPGQAPPYKTPSGTPPMANLSNLLVVRGMVIVCSGANSKSV